MREYSYRCRDFSLLTPDFKKWFVAPLLPYVPWGIPANIITLFSNLFVYIGFFVSLNYHTSWSRLIVAGCLFLYLVGDHLDGMQAKKTKTGSALGEFCDHYLDAFNNGIILYTAFMVFEINHPLLTTVVLTTSYLAHMSVFYEQFKTGWLTFEKLGSLEAVLLMLLLIGVAAFGPVHQFFTMPVYGSFRLIEILFALSAIGATGTFITTFKRTPSRGSGVWFFITGTIVLATLVGNTFNVMQLFILITLYASLYVGLIMKGHLVDGIERFPDLVVPGAIVILQFIMPIDTNATFLIFTTYLLARILLLVFQTFNALKVYWVWSNPRF